MLLDRRLRKDSRAATAVMFAFAAPIILAALGLGINVAYWSGVSIDLQRTADMAALAGGDTYKAGSSAQLAAQQAANIAELNGGSGGATRSWNTTTQVLTDGDITVQVVNGIRYAGDIAFRVTVWQSVPVFLSAFLRTVSSENLGATALAEVITGYPSCMISLNGAVNGATTATGTTLSGHTDVNVANCAIRSDSAANISGDVTVTGEAIYAGGSIGINGGSATVSAALMPDAGQIQDPLASNAALQTALATAKSASGPSISISEGSTTLEPGSYSGLSVQGNATVTLGSGIYYINGDVSFGGSATVTGQGVTIVTTGTTSFLGGSTSLLTAPTSEDASGGAIAGVVLASTTTGSVTVGGSSGIPITGVVYAPYGTADFAGDASDGTAGCAMVVANTVAIVGNVNVANNCGSYGLPVFNSLQPPRPVELVQ